MNKFREQYDRMHRWYARFSDIDTGREHTFASDNYIDEIYAFFQNCYHLKDWIRNDASVPVAVRNEVEGFINSSRSLLLSADICNSLKHLTLSRPRSSESPTFGRKHFAVGLSGGAAPSISIKYEVDTSKGQEDAFTLATDCLAEWDAFLGQHSLAP